MTVQLRAPAVPSVSRGAVWGEGRVLLMPWWNLLGGNGCVCTGPHSRTRTAMLDELINLPGPMRPGSDAPVTAPPVERCVIAIAIVGLLRVRQSLAIEGAGVGQLSGRQGRAIGEVQYMCRSKFPAFGADQTRRNFLLHLGVR